MGEAAERGKCGKKNARYVNAGEQMSGLYFAGDSSFGDVFGKLSAVTRTRTENIRGGTSNNRNQIFVSAF